ncbi:hypothetical protein AMJ86_10135 [bacterium SM23_57]|nr:MAG: hypothetical protein AMJ86_10135 [bacterium SM23_57]
MKKVILALIVLPVIAYAYTGHPNVTSQTENENQVQRNGEEEQGSKSESQFRIYVEDGGKPKIYLDGNRVGDIKSLEEGKPYILENLEVGIHKLLIKEKDYQDWEKKIKIGVGQQDSVIVNRVPISEFEALKTVMYDTFDPITSEPEGSRLFLRDYEISMKGIDGQQYGLIIKVNNNVSWNFHVDRHRVYSKLFVEANLLGKYTITIVDLPKTRVDKSNRDLRRLYEKTIDPFYVKVTVNMRADVHVEVYRNDLNDVDLSDRNKCQDIFNAAKYYCSVNIK